MKTVAVIPMKLNNVRLPNKNTKPFTQGEPLCYYIQRTLQNVQSIDSVYVYCSNPGIEPFLLPGVRFLKRSEGFDTAETSMNEILLSFADQVSADLYVLAHATSPFVSAKSIEEACQKVLSGEYDSALSVRKLQEFLWADGTSLNYNPAHIPRTQDLPNIYYETSGFYIFEKELIQQHGRRIGFRPYLKEVSQIEGMDIDEWEDFEIADAIFNFIIKGK